MSPRPRKAENADVFAALVRVMHRRGPAELTLREIASEAGVTAGALVQRFGSKRAMLLAHARYAAAMGDTGVTVPVRRTASPLEALRSVTEMYAQLAVSPRAAVRNSAVGSCCARRKRAKATGPHALARLAPLPLTSPHL